MDEYYNNIKAVLKKKKIDFDELVQLEADIECLYSELRQKLKQFEYEKLNND